MHVAVLGAGVIGLTTAWELAQRGYEVTIVDQGGEPAAGASFANGAQLSYSYVAPLASADVLRQLPGLLLSPTSPVRIRPSLDPDLIRWCLHFLAACNAKAALETTLVQLALASLSRTVLNALADAEALSFGLRTPGKLIVYRKLEAFRAACRRAELQARAGHAGESEILSPNEVGRREPGLRLHSSALAGALFTATEQVGDCHAFCQQLARRLQKCRGVEWQLGTHVRGLTIRDGAARAVDTSRGEIEANLIVMALGAEAARLASRAGFRLPIYPMKGYSLTARLLPDAPALQRSVTDADRKVVFAPLREAGESVVRVAGIADLVGFDQRHDGRRRATLMRHATETLALDVDGDTRPWAGLRPATPDSRPIIDWSPLPNLFLNTGHGALGWTLACGSARLAAQIIAGEPPSVQPAWFALDRRRPLISDLHAINKEL